MRRLTAPPPPPHRRRKVFKLSFSLNTEEEFLAFVAAYSAARGITLAPTTVAPPVAAAPVVAAPVAEEPKPKGRKPKAEAPVAEVETPAPVAEVETPAPAEEVAAELEVPKELTLSVLTEVAVKKSTLHMAGIREILSKHKVRKLIELDESDYPSVYQALCALGA